MYNILLVDDSKTIQKVVEVTLKDIEGYNIYFASNVREASEKLDSIPIDLLFVDVNLPDGNGYNIIKNIKDHQKLSRIPSYLIWGTFEKFDTDLAIECGAYGFFRKPFESEFFLKIINFAKNGDPIISLKEINDNVIKSRPALPPRDQEKENGPEEIFSDEAEEDQDFLFDEEEIDEEHIDFIKEDDFLFDDPEDIDADEDEVAEISEVPKADEPFYSPEYSEDFQQNDQEEQPKAEPQSEDDYVIRKDETVELDDDELERIKKGQFDHHPSSKKPPAITAETDGSAIETDAISEDISGIDIEAEPEDEEESILEEEEEILEISPIEAEDPKQNSEREMIEADVRSGDEPSLESYMQEGPDNKPLENDTIHDQDQPGPNDGEELQEAFEEAEESLEDTIEFMPDSKFFKKLKDAPKKDTKLYDQEIIKELAMIRSELNSKIDNIQASIPAIIEASINNLLQKNTQEILWETLPPVINGFLSAQINTKDIKERFLSRIIEDLNNNLLERISQNIIEKIDIEVIETKASEILEKICWEVVPDLSEVIIKHELDKLKKED